MLKISDLWVKTERKTILKGVSFKLKKGEKAVLLGPNGAGKTVLSQVILGNPKFRIIKGNIWFRGKSLLSLRPEQRVKEGIVVCWQSPPKIEGLKFEDYLKFINPSFRIKDLPFNFSFLEGSNLNTNLSGGEKKLSELIQILALKPKLVVFDEIDSGLDFSNFRKIFDVINKELIKKKVTTLFISHNASALDLIKPHKTLVMVEGKIICQNKNYKKIVSTIKKYGYEKCKKCPFLSS